MTETALNEALKRKANLETLPKGKGKDKALEQVNRQITRLKGQLEVSHG